MNAAFPTPDPDTAERLTRLGELLAKVAGAVLAIWALVMKVYIPLREWRLRSLGAQMRVVLAPELAKIESILKADEKCADRLEVVLEHQAGFAEELDVFLELAKDNRDRHNETAALLNAVGLSTERRSAEERRDRRFDELIETLIARRRARLREREANKYGEG